MPLWVWGILLGGGVAAVAASRRARDFPLGLGGGGGDSGGGTPEGGGGGMGSVASLSDEFWQTLWSVANDLGADPKVLGLLLWEESGITAHIKNSIGCAGINQFCPGWTNGAPDYSKGTYAGFVGIPIDQYLALAAEGQLDPYVKKYWKAGPDGSLATPRDIFWRSLLPATWKADADPSTVVNDPAVLGASYAAQVAKQNLIGWQATSGVITAGDIDRYLAHKALDAGWQLALTKIAQFDPSGGAVATNVTNAGGGHADPLSSDPSSDDSSAVNPDSTPAAGLPAADTSGTDDEG
jgi:hypothetical protein